MTTDGSVLERLRGLIVSCQAPAGHPLRSTPAIVALARCAAEGGANGLRVNGAADVRSVARALGLPVIGIRKTRLPGLPRPAITPGFAGARVVAKAGASVVAVEATAETDTLRRLPALVQRVHDELGVPLMADVSTFEEGLAARQAGADLVATTLSGYTSYSRQQAGPDLELIERLASSGVPTVGEGRFRTPAEVAQALRLGAQAVVVGTAITDPRAITSWFAAALREL